MILKQIRDNVIEDPLTDSDDEEDVEKSRQDAKHRRRKQLIKNLMVMGKKVG